MDSYEFLKVQKDTLVAEGRENRIATLMFQKAAHHRDNAMNALCNLVRQVKDKQLTDVIDIDGATQVIELIEAAVYACTNCGAVIREHECEATNPTTP